MDEKDNCDDYTSGTKGFDSSCYVIRNIICVRKHMQSMCESCPGIHSQVFKHVRDPRGEKAKI